MDKKKTLAIVIAVIILLLLIGLIIFLMNRRYTVTFETSEGVEISTQTVKRNGVVEKPEDPVREGYIFLGWYTEDDMEFDFNTKITGNIKLIAKWKAIGEVTGLSIISGKKSIEVGEELTLTLKVEPEDAKLEGLEVVWTSSDESVATVDKDGKVTGLKAGKAVITAKVNGIEASFTITVKDKAQEETNTNTNTNNKPNKKPNTNTNTNKTPDENKPAEVTYTYKWEAIKTSVIGQEYLYIVSSEGNKVAGTVTITTKSGVKETVSIPATGKIFVRDTIASVSNVKAN